MKDEKTRERGQFALALALIAADAFRLPPFAFILPPSSFILHPSAFRLHPFLSRTTHA